MKYRTCNLQLQLFSVLLAILIPTVTPLKCPKVKIATGEIQGVDKESRNDRVFCTFRGIPYAQPPVGNLRFEPPVPAANWTGVKKLDDFESPCVQFSPTKEKVIGKEDCLFINVFSPLVGNGFSKKPLPVMVWIHGGFFMVGSPDNHRAHYFMDEDVVIVTLNYRLGAFGFLNTEDGLIRGNMGLKDQVLALKWVRRNIREFGGDSSRVTLFGQSAGGAAVHYHLLSPMSKGLFHKAISQSGSAIKVWSLQAKPKAAAANLAKFVKCDLAATATGQNISVAPNFVPNPELNGTALVQCLKNVSAAQIVEVYKNTNSPLKNPLFIHAPSVEVTHVGQNDTFLSEHPFSVLVSGRQHRVPWIVGVNSEEGLVNTAGIIAKSDLTTLVEYQWDRFAAQFMQYNPHRADISRAIRRFYLSKNPPTNGAFFHPVPATVTPAPSVGPKTTNLTTSASIYPKLPTAPATATPATPAPPNSNNPPYAYPPNLNSHEDRDHVLDPFLNFQEKFRQFTNLFTDRLYAHATHKSILLQSQFSPVFAYYNNYKGELSFANTLVRSSSSQKMAPSTVSGGKGGSGENSGSFKKVSGWFKKKVLGQQQVVPEEPDHMGVCHSDELILLFSYPDAKIKSESKDFAMSRDLVKLWAQFAKDETQMTFGTAGVKWSPVQPAAGGDYNVLRFSNSINETGIFKLPTAERMRFWESLDYLPPYQE